MSAPGEAGEAARAMLALWEAGARARPERRGSAVLAAAEGEPLAAVEAAAAGARDRRLLALRRRLNGDAATARGACPACGTHLDADLSIDALSAGGEGGTVCETQIVSGGLRLTVSAPSAGDLAHLAARHAGDAAGARAALLALCVTHCEDALGAPSELTPEAEAAVAEALERLDALAAITLALDCPACGARVELPFDPAVFVWAEIDAAARRLMWQVDRLARAYGWTEAEVLALSPLRRAAYLELAAI